MKRIISGNYDDSVSRLEQENREVAYEAALESFVLLRNNGALPLQTEEVGLFDAGAIVGANSVVGSDIDSYTIVVGNPAKTLRKRFDDELIDLLLRFKWWDRSNKEINELIPILTSSDLETVRNYGCNRSFLYD